MNHLMEATTTPRRGFLRAAGLGATAAAGALVAAPVAAKDPALKKRIVQLGVPWEAAYGYAQAVKVGDTIYVSGQLSHDNQGQLIAAAPVEGGRITSFANMETQMRTAYGNAAAVLQKFGASLANVVEEVLYVLDMEAAFAVAGKVRKAAYGTPTPAVASTILVTPRLAFPEQLIEIKLIAKV